MRLPISAEFTSAGGIGRLEAGQLSLVQYPASALEAGASQVFLRVGEVVAPLTGPASGARVAMVDGAPVLVGEHGGLDHTLWWDEADGVFAWRWRVRNTTDHEVSFDMTFGLDAGLAPMGDIARNEYYVSQYLDVSLFETPWGVALGVRQNMPGATNPWLGLVALPEAASWCSDARQVCGSDDLGIRPAGELASERLQHEHTWAGLRTRRQVVRPGDQAEGAFVGWALADHPLPTGVGDVGAAAAVIAEAVWRRPEPPRAEAVAVVPTLFSPPDTLVCDDLDEARIAEAWGALADAERDGGVLLSAFVGGAHLVTQAKERAVLRPHGQVLHASGSALADASATAATVWARGGFVTQLTRGHACAEPAVTRRKSYLGICKAGGLRLACRVDGRWRLLSTPSAWLLGDTWARWWYSAHDLDVLVEARVHPHGRVDLDIDSRGREVLVCVEASADLRVSGIDLGDDAPLFGDEEPRHTAWRCGTTTGAGITLQVGEPQPAPTHVWPVPAVTSADPDAAALGRMLGWLAHDAGVHYQAPRGLEQFTGGAWGTRDVCQGPVGLLVAAGEFAELRALLLRVFGAQYPDGDWPQWFDYLPDRVRPGHMDSHGDVVYWPLLALGEYLEATGDSSVLDEAVPWVGADALLPATSMRDHVGAALGRIEAHRTPDGLLPAYGHGDWNDSLQPASAELAARLMSVWTAVLEVQTLATLARGLEQGEPEWAASLHRRAAAVRQAMLDVAIVDGELAGYVHYGSDGPELLVHPADRRTGLTHGLLHLIHAISAEQLDPQDADASLRIIAQHLAGPTGAYLFDKPIRYQGGVIDVFKRAEAATFWGREIGLMYTHSHLRYVEALCVHGRADEAWQQLLKVIPIGLTEREPSAARRQATCYYSSSDAGYPDRWVAQEHPAALFDGTRGFEGGWRVYSSGPGIILRLVSERFLGVRERGRQMHLDPVLPVGVGEVCAVVHAQDGPVPLRLTPDAAPPTFAGVDLAATPAHNRYRRAGWVVDRAVLARAMAENPGGELRVGTQAGASSG